LLTLTASQMENLKLVESGQCVQATQESGISEGRLVRTSQPAKELEGRGAMLALSTSSHPLWVAPSPDQLCKDQSLRWTNAH
jgi:hypothetical protein